MESGTIAGCREMGGDGRRKGEDGRRKGEDGQRRVRDEQKLTIEGLRQAAEKGSRERQRQKQEQNYALSAKTPLSYGSPQVLVRCQDYSGPNATSLHLTYIKMEIYHVLCYGTT